MEEEEALLWRMLWMDGFAAMRLRRLLRQSLSLRHLNNFRKLVSSPIIWESCDVVLRQCQIDLFCGEDYLQFDVSLMSDYSQGNRQSIHV